jgi:hypothetical protein
VDIKFRYYSSRISNYYYYTLNEWLLLIMAIKLAYMCRLVLFRSEYSDSRTRRVCNMFGCKNDDLYVVKCLLKENPLVYIGMLFIIGLAIFGIMIMIAESPLDRVYSDFQPHTLQNSIWEALCTMTTIGFGDIYPKTILGRLICFMCAIYGVAITSLMLVTVNEILTMGKSESIAYTVTKKLQVRELMKITASRLLVVINKKSKKTMDSEFQRYRQIKKLIVEFRNQRRHYKEIQESDIVEKLNHNCIMEHLTD